MDSSNTSPQQSPNNGHTEEATTSSSTRSTAPVSSESEELRRLLGKAANVLAEHVARCQAPGARIVPSAAEEEGEGKGGVWAERLATEFGQLAAATEGVGDGIWSEIKRICALATNTWSEGFLYKLYAAPTAIGVVGEALTAALNNNAHVFNGSPVGVVLEAVVASELAALAGFPAETAGGLTFPGGSYSNMHALMAARNQRFPEIKTHGMAGGSARRPVVFTSQHAHYSLEKAAIAAGIGLANVVSVPVDGRGRMDAAALRRLVEESAATGGTPFFVNATAGTTVLGAFDPLPEIARVCEDHGLWLHVDASWGGPLALFADRSVFDYTIPHGRVNSLTINPHKLLGVPLQCSVLLVRDGLRVMKEALGLGASYLFHDDCDGVSWDSDLNTNGNAGSAWARRLGGSWDVGDATMGCGRKPDAIKLWIVWRYYGTRYFTTRVNRARTAALGFAQMLLDRNRAADAASSTSSSPLGFWRLLTAPASTCVCFWFVPRALYDSSAEFEEMRRLAMCAPDADIFGQRCYDQRWGGATKTLFARMGVLSKVLVDYAQLDPPAPGAAGVPAFFRLPFNNPNVSAETMASVLDCIEAAAAGLLAGGPDLY
ncbi:Glutamate decarboxylase 2 [Coemansia sp. BCRC 34490]|nr:Glutamate decarboxylase 2 [Coemansia sp. BCRC 34490]